MKSEPAGNIEPTTKRYAVTEPHDHRTLSIGDVVVMSEDVDSNNVLIRLSDMTLHRLNGRSGQYVHLLEIRL